MEISLNNIRQGIQLQKTSDRPLSNFWVVVFLLPLLSGILVSLYILVYFIEIFSTIDFTNPQSYTFAYDWVPPEFMIGLFILGILGVISLVLSLILNFLLINRRNIHFKRQKFLTDKIIKVLFDLSKSKNIALEINQSYIDESVVEMNYAIERSPILWAILSVFVPFVQFYVFYFLMNDFFIHEHIEDVFWDDVNKSLTKLGFNFPKIQRSYAIPVRSFVLYLILLVVSAGFFIAYWVYVLLKDPNEHFKHHIKVENQLLRSLESATV